MLSLCKVNHFVKACEFDFARRRTDLPLSPPKHDAEANHKHEAEESTYTLSLWSSDLEIASVMAGPFKHRQALQACMCDCGTFVLGNLGLRMRAVKEEEEEEESSRLMSPH